MRSPNPTTKSCHNGVSIIPCVLLGAACAALIAFTRLPSVDINFCRSIFRHLAGASIGTNWKFEACFYCPNATHAARSYLSAPGASPKHWVETSVRFDISNYMVALRSAIRKATACFYPQNIRHAAQQFFCSRHAAKTVGTLLYGWYLKSIWHFNRLSERFKHVFTFTEYQAHRSRIPLEFRLRRVAQIVGEHYCTVDIWNLVSGDSIGWLERLQRVFTLRISVAPPKDCFLLRRVAQTVGEHYCAVDIWNLVSGDSISWLERLQRVFTLRMSGAPSKDCFLLRRIAQTVGEHYSAVDIWNLVSGDSIGY